MFMKYMEEGKYVFVFERESFLNFSKIEDLNWVHCRRRNKLFFTLFDKRQKKKNPEMRLCKYNPKKGIFECPKNIKYTLEFRNYKNLGTKVIGDIYDYNACYFITPQFDISKLHHFINRKVIKHIYINNYRFSGDFIIFDDMSAVLVEYGDNEIYERVCEGYVKKLDGRNIFIKFLDLFKKK